MDELTAFVKARLDEDELAARNAGGETWDFTGVNCEVRARERKGYGEFGRVIAYCRHGNAVEEDLALAIHVAQHDPARALREVAAKRAHLAAYEGAVSGALEWGITSTLEDILYSDAAVWSDHPDYRQEWKP